MTKQLQILILDITCLEKEKIGLKHLKKDVHKSKT